MLDITLVRAHQEAATGKGGPRPGSGAFARKIDHKTHLGADAHGQPLRVILTP